MLKSAEATWSPWLWYLWQPIRWPQVTLIKKCHWEQLARVFSPAQDGFPTGQDCEDVAKKKKSALPHQLSEVPDWLLVLEALSTPDPRGPSPETGEPI